MPRRWARVSAMAACLALSVAIVGPPVASSDPGSESIVRVIDLTQLDVCPEWACPGGTSGQPASARVTFHAWGEASGQGFLFKVRGLGWAPDAWALYLVDGSLKDGTILGRWTFNAYPWGSVNSDAGFGAGVAPDVPGVQVLTAFVAYEADDGRWVDRDQDLIVLAGTSTR